MILVIDIGNTNMVVGIFDNGDLKHHWRIETNRNKTEDEYGMLVKSLFDFEGVSLDSIQGIIMSSVVPPVVSPLERMCKKYFNKKPLIVGAGIKTGLNIKTDQPKEVGADRIVNAVAGIQLYGYPLILVDFGTATTFCYVDSKKQYLGGAIAPGVGISTEALFSRASKLPRIDLTAPEDVIGKNTVHAMQSGIIYGYVGQVEGIVNRMKAFDPSVNPKVVATGGLANLISKESSAIDIVDPFLTLKGLYMIYHKNAVEQKEI